MFKLKNIISKSPIFTNNYRTYLNFTNTHKQIQDVTKKLVQKEIVPFEEEWEKSRIFDGRRVFSCLGKTGLLGLTRDVAFGGQELSYSHTIAFYEAFAQNVTCGGVITGVSVHTDMALPALANFGSDTLKQQFLAPSLSGDYIACVGVTESSGGSDVAALKTYATKDGDDLIINGQKMWITNGLQADWICLLTNTSQNHYHRNKSLICVPLQEKGITRHAIKKLGLHSSDTAIINFDNVRVPISNVIGDLNAGFMYQMIQFQEERLCVAAITVPTLRRILDLTIEYCKQRKTFGKPLIENQSIHFRFAELRIELELLHALLHRAAYQFEQGENVTFAASALKLKCGRLAREICDVCLQYHGAIGYSDDMFISRAYRDFRQLSIAGGADEIMLGIICKLMNILPPKK